MKEKANQLMRLPMLLVLPMIFASFLVSITIPVSAQNHCTASNPCQQICGDHICAPGEYAKMQAAKAQSGNNTNGSNSLSSGNITTTSQSTGNVIAGVVSYTDTASDGTVVIVRSAHPMPGQLLTLGIAFYTPDKNTIANQNYAIIATQDGISILSKLSAHTDSGIDTLTSPFTLSSADPISIQVTLNGIGPTSADPSTWTGLKGEVLNFTQSIPTKVTSTNMTTTQNSTTKQLTNNTTNIPLTSQQTNVSSTKPQNNNSTVPEFGSLSTIVLAVAISGIVVFSARTKIIPRY